MHAYFVLDWQILWDAANGDIPDLRRQVVVILASQYPESHAEKRKCHDASASSTAVRFFSITARYARVVASGFLRPCSHS